MALSNWDELCLNEKGARATNMKSFAGVVVEVYKNWLYIKDAKAWHEKGAYFCKPTIMQVNLGELIYRDVQITAIRGPQNGIFFYVSSQSGKKVRSLTGCGVYAYSASRYISVSGKSKQFLNKLAKEHNVDFKFGKLTSQNQGDNYFGVKTQRKPFFEKLLKGEK